MTRKTLISEFASLLAMAQVERPKRQEFVKVQKTYPWSGRTVEETDPAYVVFERETMLTHVNTVRREHQLPPATITMVEQADRMASGHIDYSRKFALYCAEIALGENNPSV